MGGVTGGGYFGSGASFHSSNFKYRLLDCKIEPRGVFWWLKDATCRRAAEDREDVIYLSENRAVSAKTDESRQAWLIVAREWTKMLEQEEAQIGSRNSTLDELALLSGKAIP